MSDPDELLRIEGIRKTFPGVVALDGVALPDRPQEPVPAVEYRPGPREPFPRELDRHDPGGGGAADLERLPHAAPRERLNQAGALQAGQP